MKKLLSKKMIVIYMVVITLAVAGYFYNEYASQVEVESYTVDMGSVVETIVENGYIEAIETAEIQANVMGTVAEIYTSVGDMVDKGDVILAFDDDVLVLQIERLESEIKALDFQLLEASKPADQERIRNASIMVSQAKDSRDKSKTDYENNLVLYASGALSKNDLNLSEKWYKDAVKAYSMAVNESILVNKGISSNIESQYNASIEALYTQKKILERQLDDYTVTSPMTGVVLSQPVKVGHYTMTGQELLEIADLSQLKLSCEILEDDYYTITPETVVKLHDKHNDLYFDAEVSKIFPKSESTISDLGIRQNRVKIEVIPTEVLNNYIVGQELDVEFIIHDLNTVRIPVDSVYKSKGDHFVFVIENKTLKSKKVELGVEGEDFYEVLSGLAKDDTIVKVISNDLDEGQKVK